MDRRLLLSAVVAVVAALALWLFWPTPSVVSTSPDTRAAPEPRAPSTVSRVSQASPDLIRSADSPGADAPRSEPRHVLAPLFAGRAHHVCPAPEDVPQGRYQAGEADVLVRQGETVVWSTSDPGDATARWLGRWLGDISWSSGRCEWTDAPDVAVTFEVLDGGSHTVAGCPIGEAVTTDEDGVATVSIPLGQTCTARVVGGRDGLQMSSKVTVTATESMTVELDADLLPLTDSDIEQGLTILERMTAYQLDKAQTELDRLTAASAGLSEAEWLIEDAQARVDFMEGELERLKSEETQLEVLREFLLSQTN